MNPPVLCIIQARLRSSRLEHKMLLKIEGESLIARAWRVACEAFGEANVVVAIPCEDLDGPLENELLRIGATIFFPPVVIPAEDVLGRFYQCANKYRWHPDTVIHRWTADDWRKDVSAVRRVAGGVREPVAIGGEAFTLKMLEIAHNAERRPEAREHITYALFPCAAPEPPDDGLPWSIDTRDDYERAVGSHTPTIPL